MAIASGAKSVKIDFKADSKSAVKDVQALSKEIQRLEKEVSKLDKTQGKTSKKTQETGDSFQKLKGSLSDGIAKWGAYAAGVTATAIVIDKVATRSLQLADVQNNLRISIDKARDSSNGLIDDYSLQTSAMTAMRFGIVKTDADFAKLVKTATLLARTTGQDSTKAIQDLTTALSRSSAPILDNLGLQVNVEKANKDYARSLGKTASNLTDAEKKQAFFNAAMADADEKTRNLTVSTDSWGASFAKLEVEAQNVLDKVIQLPGNIGELGSELRKSAGLTAEASKAGEYYGRFVLGTMTLGASEAVIAFRDMNNEIEISGQALVALTNIARGLEQGRGGAFLEMLTRGRDQGAIDAVGKQGAAILGVAQSLVVGERAFDKYEKSLRKTGKTLSEAQKQWKALAAEIRNSSGVTREGSDTREFEAERQLARRNQVLSQIQRSDKSQTLELQKKLAEEEKKLHDDELKRIEERKKAYADETQARAAAMDASISIIGQGLAFGQQAAQAAGATGQRAQKVMLRLHGIESLAIGAVEVVKATRDFASFNYVGGALHSAAAAFAFAQGGLLLAGRVPHAGKVGGGGKTNTVAPRNDSPRNGKINDIPGSPAPNAPPANQLPNAHQGTQVLPVLVTSEANMRMLQKSLDKSNRVSKRIKN